MASYPIKAPYKIPSHFALTGIKKNVGICELPTGEKIHKLTLNTVPLKKRPELGGKSFYDITKGKSDFKKYLKYSGGKVLDGYQFRYIYFIDKSCRKYDDFDNEFWELDPNYLVNSVLSKELLTSPKTKLLPSILQAP